MNDDQRSARETLFDNLKSIQLKYQSKKFDFQNRVKDEMEKASLNIKTLFDEKMQKSKENFAGFHDEMEQAFDHFKNAVRSFGKK